MDRPPGWYEDPDQGGILRWWNGHGWTDFAPPAAASPGGRTNWRKVLPWLVGFAGLLVLAAALIVPKVVRSFTGSISGANVYLRDIRDGHNADAYTHLCAELRNQASYDTFVASLTDERTQYGALVGFNANHTELESGSPDAIVTVHVRTTKQTGDIEARIRKESGHWFWCGSRPASKTTGVNIHVPLF